MNLHSSYMDYDFFCYTVSAQYENMTPALLEIWILKNGSDQLGIWFMIILLYNACTDKYIIPALFCYMISKEMKLWVRKYKIENILCKIMPLGTHS